MQNIMWPKDKGSMMRVDRNDIWWNKNQINSEVEVVNSLRFLVAYNDQSYAYGVNELTADADDEEIQKQQRNGAKIDEIFNTVAPASYSTLKQYMTYIDNFHENKVIPFENKDDEYASKAGKLLKTYENCFEWFSRISAKIEKAKMDFYKSFFKALWDTVTGLVSLVGGLIKFSAATDVLVVCKLIDMSPPKWATNAYDKGIESAKMFITLQWIPALGQQVMDSVEEDGIFSVAGYGIGSLVGIKGLDKVGKMAKIAIQGGKAARILETANCVDDLLRAGLTSVDDLARAGITSVDDLLKLGVNSMDDLSKLGINSVDDLAKLGITSEEDLARLGIKSGDAIEGGSKPLSITDIKNRTMTGEDWCRYFRDQYGAENVVWENATPSQLARSWQGAGKYPGIDVYQDIIISKGKIIYRGEPNGTEYFTTKDAIEGCHRNATDIFEGLQVRKDPVHGYRGNMQGYVVNEDLAAAYGITNANPQFGNGGLPQMFVPNAQDLIDKGILVPIEKITLIK